MANERHGSSRRTAHGLLLAAILLGTTTAGLPYLPTAHAATAVSAESTLAATILPKLQVRSPEFTVQTTGSASSSLDAVDAAFGIAMKQDDYTNYAIKSYRFSSKSDGQNATVTVKVTYWEDAAQSAYVAAQSKKILASIIKPGMNAHQKVKAIHDWVVLNVAYDRTLIKHSAYDALATGKTVCQGYATLTYRLLTDAGIKSRIAEGTVSTGAHAWNLVQLDGKWYHLDTTFDDPVPDVKGRTTYGYYLVTDKQLARDHKWTLTYPAAVTPYATTLSQLTKADVSRKTFYTNLYSTLGYAYLLPANTVRTTEEIAAKIKLALKAGKTSVKVRYAQGASKKLDLQAILDAVPTLASIQTKSSSFPAGDPGDTLLELTFKKA